ncbi:MAG: glycosyltransferase family 4 protein [Betaproteobacteria bacterium]|nr:glycosyltransferase family 4 protein [Betaproteobacteria bacterium]
MSDSLRVAAFTGGDNVPSARFRLRQYLPRLSENGISVQELPARFGGYPPRSNWSRLPWLAATLGERSLAALKGNAADVAFFQREMVSTLYSAECLCRAPAVLDVDDAVWLTQRWHAVDRLAQRCRLVLCGNAYIAEHFADFAPVRLLPTGVDTERWQPGTMERAPVIVWSGSSSGLPFLYEIEPALGRVLDALPDARLRVVCDRAPAFPRLQNKQLEYLPWTPEGEVAAIQSAWVGLMPMPDTPWSRGKCSFKMLTYMACATPAVASPWGMNREVIAGGGAFAAISQDDWIDQLLRLLRDPVAIQAAGREGRRQVEERYATNKLAQVLAEALREAVA